MEQYYAPLAILLAAVLAIGYHFLSSRGKAATSAPPVPAAPAPLTVAHLQAAVAQITGAQHTAETVAQIAAKQVEHGAKLDAAAKRVEDLHARWDKDDAEKGKTASSEKA